MTIAVPELRGTASDARGVDLMDSESPIFCACRNETLSLIPANCVKKIQIY